MLPRSNGIVWMDNEQPNDEALSWPPPPPPPRINNEDEDEMSAASLSTFKSMLEMSNTTDCSFIDNNAINPLYNIQQQQQQHELFTSNLLFNPLDSCSPSQPQPFPLDPSSFLPPKPYLFDNGSCYDLSCEPQPSNFFQSQDMLPLFNNGLLSCLSSQFQPSSEFINSELGFDGYDVLPNRSKVLRPLDVLPQVGAQPTLFQKRAAAAMRNVNLGDLDDVTGKKRKRRGYEVEEDEVECSGDVSNLNYDSDDKLGVLGISGDGDDNCGGGGGDNSNANSSVTVGGGGGDQKGKKKGMPAKNLMAERRRRKKLNDRLYMLRSVVPKISKMDRASILGDAIDYLKELLQRINDLHNELESTPAGSLMQHPATSLHPLTPTPPTLPYRVKEEHCATSTPSPKNQPARVEVKLREGRAVNIHMFCARRPGLLLSTMRALENLGLDIQQAVISCFNGFALDVFRAEQCREDQEVLPEQIKSVLLDSAGFHGVM